MFFGWVCFFDFLIQFGSHGPQAGAHGSFGSHGFLVLVVFLIVVRMVL